MSLFNPFDGAVRPIAFGYLPQDQAALDGDLAKRNRDSQKLMTATRLRNVLSVREGLAQKLAAAGGMDAGLRYSIERDIRRLDDEAQQLGQTLASIRGADAQDLRARADAIERG